MKQMFITLLASLLFLGIFSCGDDDSSTKVDDKDSTDVEVKPSLLGSWEWGINGLVIEGDTIIPDTANIKLTLTEVAKDTTFSLVGTQRIRMQLAPGITLDTTAILYSSVGKATKSGDNIMLVGEKCELINMETYQLEPIADSICSTPVPLPLSELKEDKWIISTTPLLNMLSSSLSAEQLAAAQKINFGLELTRVK